MQPLTITLIGNKYTLTLSKDTISPERANLLTHCSNPFNGGIIEKLLEEAHITSDNDKINKLYTFAENHRRNNAQKSTEPGFFQELTLLGLYNVAKEYRDSFQELPEVSEEENNLLKVLLAWGAKG